MREALRKVPEKGATGRGNFFGVKAKIIGLRRQAFKQASGLVSAPDRQQSIDKPEAAYQKGTLSAGNAVRSPVPEDVISFAQLLFDRLDRACDKALVDRRTKLRREQKRRISLAIAESLSQPLIGIDSFFQDRLQQSVFLRLPPVVGPKEPERPVKRHPAHQFAMYVMARLAPHLPDPLVWLLPACSDMVRCATNHSLQSVVQRSAERMMLPT